MTDTPAVIKGVYGDFKLVRSRGVAQVVIEMPIEQAEGFIEGFGIPIPGKETWVAIALLDPTKTVAAPIPEVATSPGEEVSRPKREGPLRPSAECALDCANPAFQDWLGVIGPDEAAEEVRRRCRVASRRDFDTELPARQRWDAMRLQYMQDTGRMAERR